MKKSIIQTALLSSTLGRRLIKLFRLWPMLRERSYQFQFERLKTGSIQWLIAAERHYGGFVIGVTRKKVSEVDPRSPAELARGGMTGGDRMSARHHFYAPKYSQYLLPIMQTGRRVVLVEAGILKGTGLAMWSHMFPQGRIIGLDIDLVHTRRNMDNLLKRGAFKNKNLELYEFDQFKNNTNYLEEILGGEKIDVYIDDGFHSDETIMESLKSVFPHLSKEFVCLIEDNHLVVNKISTEWPNLYIESSGELTIIKPASENY